MERARTVALRIHVGAAFEQREHDGFASASGCKVEERFVARVVSAVGVEPFLEEQSEEAIVALPGGPVERAMDRFSQVSVDTPRESSGLVEGRGEEGGESTVYAEEGAEVTER